MTPLVNRTRQNRNVFRFSYYLRNVYSALVIHFIFHITKDIDNTSF